MSPLFDL